MDALMKPAFASVAAVLLLSLAPAAVFAKNVNVGIYAVIDQVTFDPDGASPNLVRISGKPRFVSQVTVDEAAIGSPCFKLTHYLPLPIVGQRN